MKWLAVLLLFICSVVQAECEDEVGAYQVQFPQGVGSTITFMLLNRYDQMTIAATDAELRDPKIRKFYDTLYDAGYTRSWIQFGVSSAVCQKIEEYRLPRNFGGSWSSVPVDQLTSLRVVSEPF